MRRQHPPDLSQHLLRGVGKFQPVDHQGDVYNAFEQGQVAFVHQRRLHGAGLRPAKYALPRHHEGQLGLRLDHAIGQKGHRIAQPHDAGARKPRQPRLQLTGQGTACGQAEPAAVKLPQIDNIHGNRT